MNIKKIFFLVSSITFLGFSVNADELRNIPDYDAISVIPPKNTTDYMKAQIQEFNRIEAAAKAAAVARGDLLGSLIIRLNQNGEIQDIYKVPGIWVTVLNGRISFRNMYHGIDVDISLDSKDYIIQVFHNTPGTDNYKTWNNTIEYHHSDLKLSNQ